MDVKTRASPPAPIVTSCTWAQLAYRSSITMSLSVNRGGRLVTRHPHLLANYNRAEVNFVRGEGVHLFDESGNRYIDLVAGLAVCALGMHIRGLRGRLRSKRRRWCM